MTEWKYEPSTVLVAPGRVLYKVREVFTVGNGTRCYKLTDGTGKPVTLQAGVVEGPDWHRMETRATRGLLDVTSLRENK